MIKFKQYLTKRKCSATLITVHPILDIFQNIKDALINELHKEEHKN